MGSGLLSVATGDFNGDSYPDIVAGNADLNYASVILNNGDGTFRPRVNYPVGTYPISVAVADLNGDGYLDIATANPLSNNVSILLGNGNGTFRTRVNYPAGQNTYSIVVGNFNGDGYPDLATANNASNNVSVLLGNGNGTFRGAVNYPVVTTPDSVTAGDFNGDGYMDLAASNYNSNSVSVLSGNGDGTFRPAVNFPTGGTPYFITSGDFNGDGRLDLLTVNLGYNSVSVLMGNGDGTFQQEISNWVGDSPYAAAVGDFNADGYADIAVASTENSGSLAVLVGNGNGTFHTVVYFPVVYEPKSVAIGDFNRDGRQDVATANYGGSNVSVFLNTCVPPTATPTVTPTITGSPYTATSTPTITPTRTVTNTPPPSNTPTITNTPHPTYTLTYRAIYTPVPPTPTFTPSNTPTRTPTPGPCVLPVVEDFESGTLGMFYSAGSPGWSAVADNPHSGVYAVHAPDVGYVSDQQLILSNPIAVPLNATQATLSFWHRYDFDIEGSTAWDGGTLETSINGGPWNVPAFASGGLNGVLVNCPSLNPLAGRQAWVGSSNGWVQASVNLLPYKGMSVSFRLRLGTSETVGAGGWWIDDVLISFTQSSCWTPTATVTRTATPCSPVPCTSTPAGTGTSTRTPTSTPTITPTFTPAAPCNYNITSSFGATIVPGTGDINNHCDDCVTAISMPFRYSLYGVPYVFAYISSNGNIQFSSTSRSINTGCLPSGSISEAIFAQWDDLRTDQVGICPNYGVSGCGIFTSVSGTAPNRIFNIEWRAIYFNNSAQLAHFEVRLYEGQATFDVIYGQVDQAGSRAVTGVQHDSTNFSQFSCNVSSLSNGLMTSYVLNFCPSTATATPTFTPSSTHTATFTPTTTSTPSITPTQTHTNTPGITFTPSNTLTITPTFTPAPECNYNIITTTGATIVTGTTDTGNHIDDGVTNIGIPFPVDFYGELSFTSVNVSSNGNLQFNTQTAAYNNNCMPSTGVPGPAIYAHWDDLRTDQVGGCPNYGASGCGIFTSVSGIAPDRIFNIEWRTVYFSSFYQLANFEVRLYEGDDKFDVVYGQVDQAGSSATTGVQRDGVSFSQFSCNTPSLSNGLKTVYILNPCVPTATATLTTTPTFNISPTSTNTATITPIVVGHVIWQSRPAQPDALQQLPVSLTLKSGVTEVNYPPQNTDASGFFTVSVGGLAVGTYNWRVKGSKFLANSGSVVLAGDPSTNVEMGLMWVGDANNNNIVNVSDFSIMKATFGKSVGDPGYDDRADFTGDQTVNVADFNLLKVNFGQGGAPPIGPERR